MKYSKYGLAALALIVLGSCGGEARRVPPGGGFGSNALWDDGKSEVSTYAGSTEFGTEGYPTRARLVVSMRDLSSARPSRGPADGRVFLLEFSIVSSDPARGDSAVTAVSLRRRDLEPIEMNAVDVRGRDTVLVQAAAMGTGSVRLTRLTRGDDGAERVAWVRWPAGDRPHVLWDALPLWLRQWASEKTPLEMRVWLLPGLVSSLAPGGSVTPMDATIRRMDGGTIQVPAGRFAALEFVVAAGGEADAFWLNANSPHELLKVQTARHLTLELQSTRRVAGSATRP
jgi:hypothetical protein